MKTDKHVTGASNLAGLMNLDGLDDLMATVEDTATFSRLDVLDVKILPQQRSADELEDEEQSLSDLAADAKALGVLQPILVCKNTTGGAEPFRLVAGERRLRAAILAGLPKIPAMVYGELSDELINRIQYSENTQRKNLSLLNEAQVLARDIEELGSIQAVCERRNKPASWISKRLQLLDLPEQTRKLFTENVTSDLETISMIRQVEQIDPDAGRAAAEAVREAVATGGNARKTAKAEKDKVKPPRKQAEPKPPKQKDQEQQHQEEEAAPAAISTVLEDLPEYDTEAGRQAVAEILSRCQPGVPLATVLEQMRDAQSQEVGAAAEWLELNHLEGATQIRPAISLVEALRSGRFAADGPRAAALAAYVSGVAGADFEMVAILEAV